MLRIEDFSRDNWEAVTWRIVSGSYVRGFIMSECLPPPNYVEWAMERMQLTQPGTIRIENGLTEEGRSVWKISIREA